MQIATVVLTESCCFAAISFVQYRSSWSCGEILLLWWVFWGGLTGFSTI